VLVSEIVSEQVTPLKLASCAMNRVTRMGDFSTIGRLFDFGSFCETTEVAQNNWATFFNGIIYVLGSYDKIWIGLQFGRLFH
jgi:hypothetical protein